MSKRWTSEAAIAFQSSTGCGALRRCKELSLLLATAPFALGCSDAGWASEAAEAVETSGQGLHTLAGASWVAQGPAPMINGQAFTLPPSNQNPVAGCAHTVVVHPTNANIAYVGAVNGGVWRSTNAASVNPTWTPLTDFQPSLNIGALALDRNNPNVVIAGTGRWSSLANEGGSQGEILVSQDGGNSWTLINPPLLVNEKVSGVVIRGNTLMASTFNVGLARSSNGGASWLQISGSGGLPFGPVDDLVEDRQNANRLYATLRGLGVYRSDDFGINWLNVSQNDPGAGGLQQVMQDAGSGFSAARMDTSNDGRAYVAVRVGNNEIQGLVTFVGYTTNGGASWVRMEAPPVFARGEPFFHFTVGADPTDSRFVYVAGIEEWMRGDVTIPQGSGQWSPYAFSGTPSDTHPHVDVRDIEFYPNGDLIEVNDGGVFRRPTPRTSADWVSLAGNMQNAEIHNLAYDANSRVLLAGTQDTGTIFQTTPGQPVWNMFFGGDGGDVQVDATSNPGFSIRYSSQVFLLDFVRTTYNAANQEMARVAAALFVPGEGQCSPFDDLPCNPQFYTPVELNRVTPTRIVFGMIDNVYESFNQGDNITSLGAAAEARRMFYGHPSNPDVLYVVRDVIFRRLSAAGPLAPTPTPIPTSDAQDIVLDPANVNRAYVAGGFDGVFLTPDAGSSWQNITGNLVSFNVGAVRTIEFVPGSPHGLVVVGSNRGVFATATDALGIWQEVGNLPNAPVFDMQYTAAVDLLVVGLLGRGAYSVSGLGGGGAGNEPPEAHCQDVAVDASSSCTASVNASMVDSGSFDPDGDAFNCVLQPSGLFGVGTTSVTLTCTDSRGGVGSCTASVHVGPGNTPACCPAGTNRIIGTSNNNVINGTAGADCILGLGGQDTINGLGGDDLISGGDGNDVINGGTGNDRVFGGSGQDNLSGSIGNDILDGGDGEDQCFGGDGADSLLGGQGQDRLFGEAGNDRLTGNTGDDRLEGGTGDDVLDGSGLHDVCIGGAGTDTFLICESQTQ